MMNKTLSNFMKNMDTTILNSTWHIMQFEKTFEPGVLRIWALTTEGNMFKVDLNVNKTIYINSKVAVDDPEFKIC
jgi:hypothetical protein